MTAGKNHHVGVAGGIVPGGAGLRAGLTLTELLVSTGILAIMILLGSTMLAQTQRTIRLAQSAIKSNADARAVADRFRHDVLAMTQHGFLVLLMDEGNRPHLVFLTAGTYRSLCDDGTFANAARIDYGLGVVKDDKGAEHNVLFRRATLQNPSDPVGGGYDNDHEKISLAYYHFYPLAPVMGIDPWLYSRYWVTYTFSGAKMHPEEIDVFPYLTNSPWGATSTIAEVTLPINDITQIDRLWPYMLSEVTELKIQWTDGSVDAEGRLNWYGVDNPKDEWKGKTAMSRYMAPITGEPYTVEYDIGEAMFLPEGRYCAFWAFEKKDVWPRAIRVQFKVGEPARAYDIILDLPDMHQGA